MKSCGEKLIDLAKFNHGDFVAHMELWTSPDDLMNLDTSQFIRFVDNFISAILIAKSNMKIGIYMHFD